MKKEQLIEKYFQDTLSVDERAMFDDLLNTDPDFAKEVAFQKDAQQAIIASEDASFKKTLQGFKPKSNQRQKLVRTMLIAASFALLFSLGYSLFYATPSNPTLFAENFEAYPNIIQPIVRGDNTTDLVTTAFIAYENKDYNSASSAFAILFERNGDPYALFYQGVSELALGNPSDAKPLFTGYIARNEDRFKEDAQWYLALTHLQEDDAYSAKKILEILANSEGNYVQKSKNIVDRLK